jgi:APA family basic amino acid/polyamine antiporter
VLGTAGCLVLALALPADSVLWGAVVLALGAATYGARRMRARG